MDQEFGVEERTQEAKRSVGVREWLGGCRQAFVVASWATQREDAMKLGQWMIMAGLVLAGVGASAQTLYPMGQAEYYRMRDMGPKAAPMLAACRSNVPMDALTALSRANMKATVFVSSEAISETGPLLVLLRQRRDLFEVGNLGSKCMSKKTLVASAREAFISGRMETDAERKAMRDFAQSIVDGSAAIERQLGSKPKFYAFGLDFNNSGSDPFEQNRLLLGAGAYLDRPTAAARYDALAGAKAGFGAWVPMVKLDRDSKSPVAGQNALNESSIQQRLDKVARATTTGKASESWIPTLRGSLSKELANDLAVRK